MKVLRRIRDAYRRHEIGTVVTGLITLLVIAFLWPYIVIVVPAGSAGVIWSVISGTRPRIVAGEGLHIMPPWQKISIYNLRYQTIDMEVMILTKDGLEVVINVTTRYRPAYRQLMMLHQQVGPEYSSTIVSPEVGTAVRLMPASLNRKSFTTGASQPFRSKSSWWPASASATIS